jgi:hypothetical protein
LQSSFVAKLHFHRSVTSASAPSPSRAAGAIPSSSCARRAIFTSSAPAPSVAIFDESVPMDLASCAPGASRWAHCSLSPSHSGVLTSHQVLRFSSRCVVPLAGKSSYHTMNYMLNLHFSLVYYRLRRAGQPTSFLVNALEASQVHSYVTRYAYLNAFSSRSCQNLSRFKSSKSQNSSAVQRKYYYFHIYACFLIHIHLSFQFEAAEYFRKLRYHMQSRSAFVLTFKFAFTFILVSILILILIFIFISVRTDYSHSTLISF